MDLIGLGFIQQEGKYPPSYPVERITSHTGTHNSRKVPVLRARNKSTLPPYPQPEFQVPSALTLEGHGNRAYPAPIHHTPDCPAVRHTEMLLCFADRDELLQTAQRLQAGPESATKAPVCRHLHLSNKSKSPLFSLPPSPFKSLQSLLNAMPPQRPVANSSSPPCVC